MDTWYHLRMDTWYQRCGFLDRRCQRRHTNHQETMTGWSEPTASHWSLASIQMSESQCVSTSHHTDPIVAQGRCCNNHMIILLTLSTRLECILKTNFKWKNHVYTPARLQNLKKSHINIIYGQIRCIHSLPSPFH